MKEHPILFKGEMVRALLRDVDPKTQTRRTNLKTKYSVGDRMWVKETWTLGRIEESDEPDGHPGKLYISQCSDETDLIYRADCIDFDDEETVWRPSLFMSRKQSRLILEITALREENLNNISIEDAKAEGLIGPHILSGEWSGGDTDEAGRPRWFSDPRQAYRSLWESINGPGSWDENPVVKVIEFKRVKP